MCTERWVKHLFEIYLPGRVGQTPLKGTLLLRPTAAQARLDIYTKQETTPKEQDVQQQKHRNRDDGVSVLFCFIDPRVRKIRNEASSCIGFFSRTLRCYYVAGSPGSPLNHLLDRYRVWCFVWLNLTKEPPPPGEVSYLLCSPISNVRKRTPLEEFVPGASRGVFLLTVLDEGT